MLASVVGFLRRSSPSTLAKRFPTAQPGGLLQLLLGYLALLGPPLLGPATAAAAQTRRRLADDAVVVNLYELLGPDAYTKGVMWQPKYCFAPVSQRMVDPSPANLDKLEELMQQELFAALAEATGKPLEVGALQRCTGRPLCKRLSVAAQNLAAALDRRWPPTVPPRQTEHQGQRLVPVPYGGGL
jgi:hypothetical protein